MRGLIVVSIVVATLFLIGQSYLYLRRRKAGKLFEHLAQRFSVPRRGTRIELMIGSHRIVLDAQVTKDDRPEELRLTLESNLAGEFRLTRSTGASPYDDCKHRKPATAGEPFAGWHVRSEDPGQLAALASDRRVRESLDGLAALGFTRVELAKRRLSACWPSFSWNPDDHDWDAGDAALPGRVKRAAGRLSALATGAESALHSTGRMRRGPRVAATLITLLFFPALLMFVGILGPLHLYDAYPTVRDSQVLGLMILAGTALSAIYTVIAHRLLQKSIQRGARTALIGFVSLIGFSLGSSVPILWWNGTGPQGSGRRVTVEVVRLQEDSALSSGKGMLLQKLVGEELPIEEWLTTRRAIVRSWRDDSFYAIMLNPEQFSTVSPDSGRISLTVFPGALGVEWYSEVVVVAVPP